MPVFEVEISIYPKQGLLDPQSSALLQVLHNRQKQANNVLSLTIGKQIALKIQATDKSQTLQIIEKLCKEVFIQDLIEDYNIYINEIKTKK